MTESPNWRETASTALLVLAIALASTVAAFTVWLRDLNAPSVTFLGSGNRLSVLITDGPARMVLASGDDPIAYENALAHVRPIFARRVDVLLLAGAGPDLLVPLAAFGDGHARQTNALAPVPPSLESAELARVEAFTSARRIQLGPSVSVIVETMRPAGADPDETFPAWRATVERGETRVVILSDGEAAALFPPGPPAAVVAISGSEPTAGWEFSPAVALIANAAEMSGPDLRAALTGDRRSPEWYARVHPGEALRLRFVEDGIALPGDAAQPFAGATPDPSPISLLPGPGFAPLELAAPRPNWRQPARAALARRNSSLTSPSNIGSAMRSTPVSAIARATRSVLV